MSESQSLSADSTNSEDVTAVLRWIFIVAVIFAGVAFMMGFFARTVPVQSPIQTPLAETAAYAAPDFRLASLDGSQLGPPDFLGQVIVIDIWASWCGPCRVEHPFLMQLAAEGVDLRGFNYKDAPDQAKAFLSQLGDPYTAIGADQSGRAGIEWGVYGVPETFVINGEGRIIYKHVGPIQNRDLDNKIRPAIVAAGG